MIRLIVIGLLVTSHLFANLADELFASHAFSKALSIYEKEPSSAAKIMIGFCYSNGLGVGRDVSKAYRYYKEAANIDQSNTAYDLLGDLYEDGVLEGYSDHEKAQIWYEKIDISNDQRRFNWIKRMADLEYGQALFGMYVYYMPGNAYGEGLLEKNTSIAIAYLTASIKAEYPRAMAEMASLIFDSTQTPNTLGIDLLMKSYNLGYKSAFEELSTLYLEGEVIEEYQLIWLRKKALGGVVPAMRLLGYLYKDGVGMMPDYKSSFLWYQQAAQLGDITSQVALSEYYSEGIGTRKDAVKSFFWRFQASQQTDKAFLKEGVKSLFQALKPSTK